LKIDIREAKRDPGGDEIPLNSGLEETLDEIES